MLYAGEGDNTIFLVNHGTVVWTYSTGRSGEIDDVWMLSNGNILFARQFYVEEITNTRFPPKALPTRKQFIPSFDASA